MPVASTAGQRAKWRVERAVSNNKVPKPEDLEMMQAEGIPIPEHLQKLPSSPPVTQLNPPLQNSLGTLVTPLPLPPKAEKAQDSKDTGPGKFPDRKPVGTKEKDWYDYFANRFGPFILLILWFATASLEKATFFAPTPEECRAIALPMAKICVRIEDFFKVPKWAHDLAVETDDFTSVGMAVVGYLDRIGVLERLVPYYTGLANRMGATNNVYTNQRQDSTGKTVNSSNNGAVPGFVPVSNAHVGVAGQFSPD
jgi:hypothetical protein